MAAPRGRKPAAKAVEVDLTKDQTRDEAEEAAALVAEHELKVAGDKIPDQTVGEAQLANVIAEEDEAKSTKKEFKVEVLKTGLSVNGKTLVEGRTEVVPETIYKQSEEDQIASYGVQYFRSI